MKTIIYVYMICKVFHGQPFWMFFLLHVFLWNPIWRYVLVHTILIHVYTQKLRDTFILLYVFPHFVDFNMLQFHSVFSFSAKTFNLIIEKSLNFYNKGKYILCTSHTDIQISVRNLFNKNLFAILNLAPKISSTLFGHV